MSTSKYNSNRFHPSKGKVSIKNLKRNKITGQLRNSITQDYKFNYENYHNALESARAQVKAGEPIFFYSIVVYGHDSVTREEQTVTLQRQRSVAFRQDDELVWQEFLYKIDNAPQNTSLSNFAPDYMRFIFIFYKKAIEAKKARQQKLADAKDKKQIEAERKKREEKNKKERIRRQNKKYGLLEAEAKRRHAEKLAQEELEYERKHEANKRRRILNKAKKLAKTGFL